MRKPLVAVIGATGNIGNAVSALLARAGSRVVHVGRKENLDAKFRVIPYKGIVSIVGQEVPDFVINLSNYHVPIGELLNEAAMAESIVGVAEAVAATASEWGTPVISASTYFQYAPKHLRPWSVYAELKRQAQEILLAKSVDRYGFADLIIFDTYGGHKQNKILDLILQASKMSESLKLTPGEQLVNLTHVEDIAECIRRLLSEDKLRVSSEVHEIRSFETYSILELVKIVETLSGTSLPVQIGALPYRSKEVFELWSTPYKPVPNWSQNWTVQKYIESQLKISTRN